MESFDPRWEWATDEKCSSFISIHDGEGPDSPARLKGLSFPGPTPDPTEEHLLMQVSDLTLECAHVMGSVQQVSSKRSFLGSNASQPGAGGGQMIQLSHAEQAGLVSVARVSWQSGFSKISRSLSWALEWIKMQLVDPTGIANSQTTSMFSP